jgi:predicted short-subunit dehydrogenase-like oxidoreductase (DUF2520 family)
MPLDSIALVGRGRMGTAVAREFEEAGLGVHGPYGRGGVATNGAGELDAVLLCVPDSEIPAAAAAAAGRAPLVGHTSGATPLSALAPAASAGAELFGFHPLQTLAGGGAVARLAGAGCAVAGTTPRALATAWGLAEGLGLEPFEIADHQRPAYHAAASTASNFLVTLQDSAEAVARGAGMPPADARRALLPLVRATVENWAMLGPEEALTGPVARGDEETVAVQRAAVEKQDPSLLPLFDALLDRTRQLAARRGGAPAGTGARA